MPFVRAATARTRLPSLTVSLVGAALAACFAALLLTGCGDLLPTPAPPPPDAVPTAEPQPGAGQSAGPLQPSADAGSRAPDETWDLCTIQKTKVGYAHTIVRRIEEDGRPLVRIELEQRLSLRRFGQETAQQLSVVSVETPAGRLVRFESRLTAGRQLTLARGRVDGERLIIETTTPGKTSTDEIPWEAAAGGLFTAELNLRAKPLKPGERRTHQILLPALNRRGETKLEALHYEALDVDGQSKRLLKVRKVDLIGGTPIESLLWIDERGDALRTFLPIPPPGIETRRTTKELALAEGEDDGFDLGATSVVKVARSIRDPHGTKRIKYRAVLPGSKPADSFASGISQTVKPIDDRTAEIEVRAVRGTRPADATATDPPADPPVDADRAPNNLIQSDAESIRRMAQEVAPGETDAWKLATALENHVRRSIRSKNFSQAFATAAEVAESRTGDCTEHAVLLAALCRARGLPARVAIGLVYAEELGGFAYHMWNEVWIDDHWVPLDATLGRAGIGGAHLKLLASNLDGFDAYGVFLPVFQVLGRLELEVLEVE